MNIQAILLTLLLSFSTCIPLIGFPECEFIYVSPGEDPAWFFRGIIEAWQAKGKSVDKMLRCNDNMFEVEKYLRAIQLALLDLTLNDVGSVVSSLKIIFKNMKHIVIDLVPCAESLREFRQMLNQAAHFNLPDFAQKCFKNLRDNTQTVSKIVQALMDAYKKRDCYDVAYNLGKIVELAVFQNNASA
eukprot:TRINITY_DN6247_c0_g4_i1.p1 TRINITY_DN6247_c0_g4~~TRINITY_DN6247_c0_g4_i1.p1  ORF type:complete len:187 (-),score=34.85 TRINITY_DN6247_c0_g4_i1:76-636(-)